MKKTPETIMKILNGMWSFRALITAVQLELFTKIENKVDSSEKIAEELGADKEGIKRLLNACVALGLLSKNGTYRNTEEASLFLVKGKPSYYGDMILMNGKRDSLKNLKEAILTGSKNSRLEDRMKNKEDAKIFTKAMHNNAVGPARRLSEMFDFSKYKKLLDLGGGSGAYSITLTKQNNLKAIVFDLPNVCSVAREFVKKEKANVDVVEGNFFKDKFPEGCDIVLLSQIMHSWSEEKNKLLLKKVYDYLPDGGAVIINDFLLNEDKTGPLYPALFSLNMLINSDSGSSYTESEIKSMLEEAGFKYLKTIKLGGPVTSIIAEK